MDVDYNPRGSAKDIQAFSHKDLQKELLSVKEYRQINTERSKIYTELAEKMSGYVSATSTHSHRLLSSTRPRKASDMSKEKINYSKRSSLVTSIDAINSERATPTEGLNTSIKNSNSKDRTSAMKEELKSMNLKRI